MSINIYLEYPDKIERFDICKDYGIDPCLQIGTKPLPKLIDLEEIVKDFNFLLKLLPLEIWSLIFKILYKDELVKYKHNLSCDTEYNLHRIFKQKRHTEKYKDFDIEIIACPSPFQFYEMEYGDIEIKEYFSYYAHICHEEEERIENISKECHNYTKIRSPLSPTEEDNRFSICLENKLGTDFVFHSGFNLKRIENNLKYQKNSGKIATFKTIPYLLDKTKKIIDNYYG